MKNMNMLAMRGFKATLYPKTIFSLLLVIFLMISPSLF